MPSAGHVRVAIDNAVTTADFSQTAGRSNVVVLQEWEKAKLHSLKAANPAMKVLMYKNLSSMLAASSNGNASTGVTTQEAASHPEWYLTSNTTGTKFNFWGYDYLWAADIGDRSYQDRWAANVLAKLKADSWDGVFVDDTNPTIRYHYTPESVAGVPDRRQLFRGDRPRPLRHRPGADGRRASSSSRTSAPGATTARRSAAGCRTSPAAWRSSSPSGATTPRSATSPASTGTASSPFSRRRRRPGKYSLIVSHSTATDANAARYGWATTLLAGTGKASFSLAENYTRRELVPGVRL